MPSIHDRRAQALRGHRAVTRKISRQKAANEVQVSGSKYDPRESPEWIRAATPKELNRLIREQKKFLDRSVQFVPDARFKPLPVKLWSDFKKAEAKKNEFVQKYYEPFKDIEIGPSGMTVDSRMRLITPMHAHMGERTTDNPYKKANKSSTSVYGESGLQALIKDMRKKATKKHQREALSHHKDGVLKMLDAIGNDRLTEKMYALNSNQWALLWKYTQFASVIKRPYGHQKDSMASRKGVTNSQQVATDLAVAEDYLDWALNVKNLRS